MVFPNQEQSNINSWTSQKWLSSQTDFTKPNVTSKNFGISSFSYMIANAWNMVPNDMKNVNASLLSLQAMSKLCFLWRFRQHILNHCNAPFVGKLGSCFFTSSTCIFVCNFALLRMLFVHFAGGNWLRYLVSMHISNVYVILSFNLIFYSNF